MTRAPKGDQPETAAPSSEVALRPMSADEGALQRALLTAIGFDRLNEAQRELALAIARQYGLDPMLRHLVIVDGKPYITRDGLLHVAHGSGQFDGIEVERPVLDEDGRYWRTWATVWRKDMSRPFRYPGRYPTAGGNAKYPEEMCIKVAEVFSLRRAFDVAAPVLEERWAGDDEPETVEQPATLADRIAARVAAIEADGGEIVPESLRGTDLDPGAAPAPVAPEPPQDAPGAAAAPEAVPEPAPDPAAAPAASGDVGGLTLAQFREAVGLVPQDEVRATARLLFPGRTGFGDLGPAELQRIVDELDRRSTDALLTESQLRGEPGDLVSEDAVPAREAVEMCGQESPFGGGEACTMDAGHRGTHRAGLRGATW